MSARVTALQLRYHITDSKPTASATGSANRSLSSDVDGSSPDGIGLSTGAKAAVGTVIPLLFILEAPAAFLLWRRRKQRGLAAIHSKGFMDEFDLKMSYEIITQHPYKGPQSEPNVSHAAASRRIYSSHG